MTTTLHIFIVMVLMCSPSQNFQLSLTNSIIHDSVKKLILTCFTYVRINKKRKVFARYVEGKKSKLITKSNLMKSLEKLKFFHLPPKIIVYKNSFLIIKKPPFCGNIYLIENIYQSTLYSYTPLLPYMARTC